MPETNHHMPADGGSAADGGAPEGVSGLSDFAFVEALASLPFAALLWRSDGETKADLRMMWANDKSSELSGPAYRQLTGQTIQEAFPDFLDMEESDLMFRASKGEGPFTVDMHYVDELIDEGWYRVHYQPVVHRFVLVIFENITDGMKELERRSHAEAAMSQSEDRLGALLDLVPDLVLRLRSDGVCLDLRPGAGIELQAESRASLGHQIGEVLPPRLAASSLSMTERALGTGRLQTTELQLRLDDRNVHLQARAVVSGSDEVTIVVREVTEQVSVGRNQRRLSLTDPVTGLANRAVFIDHLTQALKRLSRAPGTLALIFLDLDQFKLVNDSLGHPAGDELLVQVAEALRRVTRPVDTVARLGGDEFVLLVENVADVSDVVEVAERIRGALARPFPLRHDGAAQTMTVTASVGLVLNSDPGADPHELLSQADTAMYRAKDSGRDKWALYNDDMRAAVMRRMLLEEALKKALDNEEFSLEYQPIVEVSTGEVVAAEALLRWDHPELGRLTAGDFIDLAEDTGLIVPIGQWVTATAARDATRWNQQRDSSLAVCVSVNVSARQLAQPDFRDVVRDALGSTGCEPGSLCLEITETSLMDDPAAAQAQLEHLVSLGIAVSVDDFGTGYSSLSYLKRFPVHALKIDRSFVDGLGYDDHDDAIVEATVDLCHILGLVAAAEGVETEQQLEILRSLGCDYVQGYHVGRPKPLEDFLELLGDSGDSKDR